jgi:hypothetical protein
MRTITVDEAERLLPSLTLTNLGVRLGGGVPAVITRLDPSLPHGRRSKLVGGWRGLVVEGWFKAV